MKKRKTKPNNSKSVESHLKNAITCCLGGPGGDPEACNYEAAARIVKVLKLLGFKVDKDTINLLKNNEFGTDFLDDKYYPDEMT